MKHFCPLCNDVLIKQSSTNFFCPKMIHIKGLEYSSHYKIFSTYPKKSPWGHTNHRQIMIVHPYKVYTYYNNMSILGKFDDDGYVQIIMRNNSEFNIPPILPAKESILLNRVRTIALFS